MVESPYHVVFEANLYVNGGSQTCTLPHEWFPVTHPRSVLIFPKMRLITAIIKDEIPTELKNRLLFVLIDQIPANTLMVRAADEHESGYPWPVITTLWIENKFNNSDFRVRMGDTAGVTLPLHEPISKLTVSLKTFPVEPELKHLALKMMFHLQLR